MLFGGLQGETENAEMRECPLAIPKLCALPLAPLHTHVHHLRTSINAAHATAQGTTPETQPSSELCFSGSASYATVHPRGRAQRKALQTEPTKAHAYARTDARELARARARMAAHRGSSGVRCATAPASTLYALWLSSLTHSLLLLLLRPIHIGLLLFRRFGGQLADEPDHQAEQHDRHEQEYAHMHPDRLVCHDAEQPD